MRQTYLPRATDVKQQNKYISNEKIVGLKIHSENL